MTKLLNIEAEAVAKSLRILADECIDKIDGAEESRGHDSWLTTMADGMRHAAHLLETQASMLRSIAELGDKTLICVSDEHGQKCYSDGAHNAFAQCASLAKGVKAGI